ncbi:MAG: trigger factor [Azospirillaceae bacterium]|nr:trigger factor [Azospirillaceae bacterium]
MQITETSAEGLKRELKVEIPAQDIEEKVQHRLVELSHTIRLQGFRPGKVPLPLVQQRYGQSVRGEVIEEAVGASARQAIADRGFRVALQPKVGDVSFNETGLQFTVAVELLPEIEPIDPASLELERLVSAVDDAAIDAAIARLADSRKSWRKVEEEREARSGDALVIDFDGSVDGERRPGMKAEGHQLELGSASFIPGFEEQLIGARPGEHRQVTVTFPADYHAEELSGKQALFEIDVKELREPEAQVIDDAFAQGLGLTDLADLKGKVSERLGSDYSRISRARLKRQILDRLADAHSFTVPEGMVDAEFDAIWSRLQEEIKNAENAADLTKDEAGLKVEYRAIAERRVRLGLVLSEIGRRNNIQVAPEELSRAVVAEAQRYRGREREVLDFFRDNPEASENLRAPIYEDKVIDFIVELAKVTERAVSVEELTKDPDEVSAAVA